MKSTIAAVLAALPMAASADVDCAAFAKQIDQSQRLLSMLRAERGFRSAPDLDARMGQELALLQINVSIALKSCPAPVNPIKYAYSKAAATCQNAVKVGDDTAAARDCEMAKWSADP